METRWMNLGRLRNLTIWLVLLMSWEGAYRIKHWPAYIFPAPSGVIDSTLSMLGINTGFAEPLHSGWPKPSNPPIDNRPFFTRFFHSDLVIANIISAIRLLVGFAISILLGAFLGAIMWRFWRIDDFFGPLFLGLQTLPSVCWVPLAVLLCGLNEKGILFVLILGSAFGVAISMRDGLRTIPPLYQRAGLMLGARKLRLYRYVMLPAALPAMASSLRQGFSFA